MCLYPCVGNNKSQSVDLYTQHTLNKVPHVNMLILIGNYYLCGGKGHHSDIDKVNANMYTGCMLD